LQQRLLIGRQPIKITLIHNPEAGKGREFPLRELVKLIRAAGHKVDYQSSSEKKWHKVLKRPGDFVAVAGGDGTVSKVARRLIGSLAESQVGAGGEHQTAFWRLLLFPQESAPSSKNF
jgi:hypothetical protein